MATTAAGSAARLAMRKESTYGAAAVGIYTLMAATSFRLAQQQGFQAPDLIGQGRDPGRPERDPVVQVRGNTTVPIDVRNIGYWFRLLMGPPVTTGAGPFTHVFESGADSLPSNTIEAQFPDLDPDMFNLGLGVMGSGLSISMEPNGRAYAEIELLASSITPQAASVTGGGETVHTVERFTQAHGEIRRAGVALAKVLSARLQFANTIEESYYVGGGGLVGDLVPALVGVSGTIVTRLHPGLTATLFTDASAQAVFDLDLRFVKSPHTLTLFMDNAELARPQIEIPGPGGVQVTFNYVASKGGATPGLRATLVNDVATAYA